VIRAADLPRAIWRVCFVSENIKRCWRAPLDIGSFILPERKELHSRALDERLLVFLQAGVVIDVLVVDRKKEKTSETPTSVD
jgi:hypothetical protein